MMQLYLHSPIGPQDVLLKYLRTGMTLPFFSAEFQYVIEVTFPA
jgi:hypothetical protein